MGDGSELKQPSRLTYLEELAAKDAELATLRRQLAYEKEVHETAEAEYERQIVELRTKLAFAEDAANKGDRARQEAGGMELEIAVLREKLADVEQANRVARDLCAQATERADALQTASELRYAADQRAIERWQKAHPGNDLRWPNHGDLCVWLMGELEEARKDSERLDWMETYSVLRIKTFTSTGKPLKHVTAPGTSLYAYTPSLRSALDAARQEAPNAAL